MTWPYMTLCGMVHIRWSVLIPINIYMWWLWPWRQIDVIWMFGYDDHIMWSLCLVSILVYGLGCISKVMSMWMTMLGLGMVYMIYDSLLLCIMTPTYVTLYECVILINIRSLRCNVKVSCLLWYNVVCDIWLNLL